MLLQEYFVSHVRNFSESAVRKRFVARNKIICLSKRKMQWGFFSTILKSAILNHVDGRRKKKIL